VSNIASSPPHHGARSWVNSIPNLTIICGCGNARSLANQNESYTRYSNSSYAFKTRSFGVAYKNDLFLNVAVNGHHGMPRVCRDDPGKVIKCLFSSNNFQSRIEVVRDES
jgi:hypothetical protein